MIAKGEMKGEVIKVKEKEKEEEEEEEEKEEEEAIRLPQHHIQ